MWKSVNCSLSKGIRCFKLLVLLEQNSFCLLWRISVNSNIVKKWILHSFSYCILKERAGVCVEYTCIMSRNCHWSILVSQYTCVKVYTMSMPWLRCICLMCAFYLELIMDISVLLFRRVWFGTWVKSTLGFCQWGEIPCLLGTVKYSLLTHEVSKANVLFVMIWCWFMW